MPIARATKADIKRAVEVFEACGFEVGAIEITKSGTIRVIKKVDAEKESPQTEPGPKEW